MTQLLCLSVLFGLVSTLAGANARDSSGIDKHQGGLANFKRHMANPQHLAQRDLILSKARDLESRGDTLVGRDLGKRHSNKRESSSGLQIALADYYHSGTDSSYLAPLAFGTPPQNLWLHFDTGSSDLYALGPNATTGEQASFNYNASSTFHALDEATELEYGDGAVVIDFVVDTVTLGSALTLVGKEFGVSRNEISNWKDEPMEGNIGMGSSSISSMGIPTFFENLMMEDMIENPFFSLYLARQADYLSADEESSEGSGVIMGSQTCMGCLGTLPDGVTTTGPSVVVPVTEFGFWNITLDGVSVNGAIMPNTSGYFAIMDSGTTYMVLPSDLVTATFSSVDWSINNSSGLVTVPSSLLTTNTSFGFSFGGQAFTISLMDLVVGQDGNTTTLAMEAKEFPSGETPHATIGDTFLKNVYSVYSYSTNGSPAVILQQLAFASSGTPAQTQSYISGAAPSTSLPSGFPATATASVGNVPNPYSARVAYPSVTASLMNNASLANANGSANSQAASIIAASASKSVVVVAGSAWGAAAAAEPSASASAKSGERQGVDVSWVGWVVTLGTALTALGFVM